MPSLNSSILFSFIIFLTVLSISFQVSIKLGPVCNKKEEINYFSDLNSINIVILILIEDTNNEYEDTYCFYNEIFTNYRNYAFVTLHVNLQREMEHDDEKKILETFKTKQEDIALIILLPYPDSNILVTNKIVNVLLTRYSNVPMVFFFYKHSIQVGMDIFLNFLLFKFKILNTLSVTKNLSNSNVYYTYNPNIYQPKIKLCAIKSSLKRPSLLKVMAENLKLRTGFPVKITIFIKSPGVFEINRSHTNWFQDVMPRASGLVGRDSFLIGLIVEKLGLDPTYINEVENFGIALKNGSITGVLGEIVRLEVDLSANSRFITAYGVDYYYTFLGFVSLDRLCLIVPDLGFVHIWIQVFMAFTVYIWITILSILGVSAIFRWFYLNYVLHKNISLFLAFLESYFSLIMPIDSRSVKGILLLSHIVLGLTIVPLFQGNLRSVFTKRISSDDMDTLEDVDKNIKTVFTVNIDKNLVFTASYNKVFKSLNEKSVNKEHHFEKYLADVVDHRAALVSTESDARLLLRGKYRNIRNYLHIVKESPREYKTSLIANINFPWSHDIQVFTQRLQEAGIIQWFSEISEFTVMMNYGIFESASQTDHRAIGFNDMYGPFILHAVGVFISSLALILEYFFHKYLYKL